MTGGGKRDESYEVSREHRDGGKRITVVRVKPGGTVPEHRHDTAYTVKPLAHATLVRVTHHEDGSTTEETLEHRPGAAYHVPATAPGKKISIRNSGTTAAHFEKDFV